MADMSTIHTLEQAKKELTKAAYGSEKVKAIDEIRQELAKSVFEARKAQLKAQLPVFEKRKELVKDVKNVSCRGDDWTGLSSYTAMMTV